MTRADRLKADAERAIDERDLLILQALERGDSKGSVQKHFGVSRARVEALSAETYEANV